MSTFKLTAERFNSQPNGMFWCRSGWDWGGWTDREAAEPADSRFGQDFFCQGATCAAGLSFILQTLSFVSDIFWLFYNSWSHILAALFFYPHSRFPECFSWGQMVGLSRRFPWQQTTSHWWHSTCTSLTVDHSEPTIYLAVIYGETERFDEQPCLMLTIYTLLINIILYINVCWMESGVQVSQLWVMFHLKPLIFGYWTERGKCI